MLLGGWRALRQKDIKLLLAYGTVSQLGFLVVVFAVGTRSAALAGVAMLLAHALFKATLFLVVGIVDHQHRHPRPARAVRGRPGDAGGRGDRRRWPGCRWPGVPPLFGFVAKESVFAALLDVADAGDGTAIGPAGRLGRPRRRRARLGADRRLHRPLPVGRLRGQAGRRRRPSHPGPRSASSLAPVAARRLCLAVAFARRLGSPTQVDAVRRPASRRARTTPTSRSGTASGCRWRSPRSPCSSAWRCSLKRDAFGRLQARRRADRGRAERGLPAGDARPSTGRPSRSPD